MAKSGVERQITHIKDIFPSTGSTLNAHENTRQTSQKPPDNGLFQSKRNPQAVQAPNGDVFFKKAEAGRSAYQGSQPKVVSGSNSVRIPSSRNKRPAPKPPDTCIHTEDTSRGDKSKVQPLTSVSNRETNVSNVNPRSLRSPTATGHHLDEVTAAPDSENDRVGQTFLYTEAPSHVPNGVNTGHILSTASSLSGSDVETKTTITSSDGRKTPGLMELNGGPQPPGPEGEPDTSTCAASSLSDSGTTSNSSGYQSEETQDIKRTSSGIYSVSISRVAPLPEPTKDDGFDEEEFTVDFDEEDEINTEGHQTRLYTEYQGEDFARYLQDDTDQYQPSASPSATLQRTKHKKNKDPSSLSSSTLDKTRKQKFKDKFGQMFVSPKQNRHGDPAHNTNIQTFSFADSKIGVILDNGGSPGVDRRQATTVQDCKDVGLPKSSWNADTLSARSLQNSTGSTAIRKKRSSSVSDILDMDYPDPNSHAYGQRDFESFRKNQMYDSKGRSTGSKKKGSLWSRFTRTLKKKDPTFSDEDNTAVNPLAYDYAADKGRSNSTSDVAL